MLLVIILHYFLFPFKRLDGIKIIGILYKHVKKTGTRAGEEACGGAGVDSDGSRGGSDVAWEEVTKNLTSPFDTRRRDHQDEKGVGPTAGSHEEAVLI